MKTYCTFWVVCDVTCLDLISGLDEKLGWKETKLSFPFPWNQTESHLPVSATSLANKKKKHEIRVGCSGPSWSNMNVARGKLRKTEIERWRAVNTGLFLHLWRWSLKNEGKTESKRLERSKSSREINKAVQCIQTRPQLSNWIGCFGEHIEQRWTII